ncbi:MAG: nucleotidyltransferase domain-containing protein [Chloroflexi bacterium]|nr:nucleotidyltransferase domain-containing protein [Chloroflexota bacterium]
MVDPIARREAERARLIALAREYVAALSIRLPIVAAAVVGSVARGDFNVWSDIDVVVVAEGLPASILERQSLLLRGAPVGIQPVGFEPDEFRAAFAKRNRLAREALEAGVVLVGDRFFRASAAVAR